MSSRAVLVEVSNMVHAAPVETLHVPFSLVLDLPIKIQRYTIVFFLFLEMAIPIIEFPKLNGEDKANTMAQITNGWGFFKRYEEFDLLMVPRREFPTNQRLILGGDLNGHIGAAPEGYAGVLGGFGYGVRHEKGRVILDFAIAHDLVVVNSHFKKRDHHLVTFQSEGRCTQIDYLMVRKGDLKACKDCRVFPREACSSQHNLFALDILFKSVQRRREGSALPRILWKNLSEDATEAFRSKVAEDTLGVAIGTSKTHTARRESWWFFEEVQAIVAVKQARFRDLLSCREGNEGERLRAHERYKEAKRQKKVVAQSKEKAYEDMYKKLDSKEGENDIFRIAKAQGGRRRDLGDICFIKDEEGRTVTDEDEIKKRWGEYFSSL
nr:retrovirus-related Pol polyprotein LINE-1 [Tanacetum cinerariifolium]